MNGQCSLPPWQPGKIVSLSSLPSLRRLCGSGAEEKTILSAVTRLPLYRFTFLSLHFFITELFIAILFYLSTFQAER
jgi:hypothetical protein